MRFSNDSRCLTFTPTGTRVTKASFRRRLSVTIAITALVAATGCAPKEDTTPAPRPHIIFILTDDMGFGDPSAYNPDSRVSTPHMDRLAREGLRFTDAHTPGAVCTPTRYAFFTGHYYWRLGLRRPGLDGHSPNIIDLEMPTVASVLRDRGYRTVCVGKWHMGMGTELPVDYFQRLDPNPTTFGFDYYFGIPASLDQAPYLYIENDRAVIPPSEEIEGTPHGTAEFYRGGGIAPGFVHEEVLPTLTRKAVEIIDDHDSDADRPLFLFFSLNAPHTPWLPVPEARGKSEAGAYGDFVWQVDTSIGDVLAALERNGMADNALVIVTSDNGGLQSWIPEEYNHSSNGPFRGQKGDAWEGGHRVPFIARWPGRIPAGAVSEAMICLTDMLPTFAALTADDRTAAMLPGPDAINVLDALLGSPDSTRDFHVVQSVRGLYAIRHGDWKLIEGLGSGGLRWIREENQPVPGGPEGQLYNLADDPGETRDLWMEHPDKVSELQTLLDRVRAAPQ